MSELDNIIRAAQKGDEAAFEQLLDYCYEVVSRYATKWHSPSIATNNSLR